jgi:hypothetical protein
LEVHGVAIHGQSLDHELDAQSNPGIVVEGPAHVAVHKSGFPHAAIPGDD